MAGGGRRGCPMSGVGWVDLTVSAAEPLRDFYADVIGWRPEPVDMGGYADFTMTDPTSGVAVAGVCHARGGNAGLPPVWMVYFTVADLDASLARCVAAGGELLGEVRTGGGVRFAAIRDPAGTVCSLVESPAGG
jgi:uncharacterized protein